MARVYGGNADFYLDDQWLEGDIDSITISFDVSNADITSFTDVYQNVIASAKKDTKIELAGSWDSDTDKEDEVIFECIGASYKTSKFEPAGATTCYYQCSAANLVGTLVTRYSISLPVGDKASFTASLQNSGSTTRETS